MGHKIFVSYKYADSDVKNLNPWEDSTVRDYVTEFQNKLDDDDNINKGEEDDEDLSELSRDTIWEKLKDRIYDSSITVVFISPNMRETDKPDRDQWIPWEISYSLKEVSRRRKDGKSVTSRSNAMIAVVLPDSNGSYSYYLEPKTCCLSSCTTHHCSKLFTILRENKFNLKSAETRECDKNDGPIWTSVNPSYIEAVKWDKFIADYNEYITRAIKRQDNIEEYEIRKEVIEDDKK